MEQIHRHVAAPPAPAPLVAAPPVPPQKVEFVIAHKGMPHMHMRLEKPTLVEVQKQVLATYDVDVTKPPAYLLYHFNHDKDNTGNIYWSMLTTQDDLDYVIERTLKANGRVALRLVAQYDPKAEETRVAKAIKH